MWDSKKDKVIVGLLARNSLLDTKRKDKFTAFNYDYKKLYGEWKCKEERKDKAFWYLTSIIDTDFYALYALQSAYALKSKITSKQKVEKGNFSYCCRFDYECKYHLDNAITNIYTAFELMAIVLSIHLNQMDIEGSRSRTNTLKKKINNEIKRKRLTIEEKELLESYLKFYESKDFRKIRDYRKSELHGHRNRLIVYLPRMNSKDLYHEDIFNITIKNYFLFHKCFDVLLEILNKVNTGYF